MAQCCIHAAYLSQHPSGNIKVMDHEIIDNSTGFFLVSEPRGPLRERAGPVQTCYRRAADISAGDGIVEGGIFREIPHDMRDVQCVVACA